jgi:outer membrane protein TolC
MKAAPLLAGLAFCGVLEAQQPAKMAISLDKAIEIALAPDGNTRAQLAAELVRQAEARSAQARGALLPNVDGAWSYQNFTRNLAAFGVRVTVPLPGVAIPEFVGPIDVFDLRATASQSLFDLSSIKRYQSSKAAISAAKQESNAARNLAAAAAARAYSGVQRSAATVETAKANIALAERLLRMARSQKEAGTATGIDVTRAETALSSEKQRLIAAEEELTAARLEFLRVLNLPLGTDFELTDALVYRPAIIPELAAAIDLARAQRPELKAQDERKRVARLGYDAAKWQRLPSVAAFGDYGSIGTGLDAQRATRVAGVSVRIPIFDGGRRDAARAESASLVRQEEIRAREVAQQVELEIRLALDQLTAAENQVKVSLETLALSEKEMAQAERRYLNGVAPGLEVTDAQTRLARARESNVAALHRQRLARINLGVAIGALDQFLD